MSVVNYSELDYKRPTKPLYKFPTWAVGIGWGMAAFAAIWIPLMILYRFYERGISREVKTFTISSYMYINIYSIVIVICWYIFKKKLSLESYMDL